MIQSSLYFSITSISDISSYHSLPLSLSPPSLPPCGHRDVKVSASLPESLLQYWSSVARQQGVECTVDKGEFSIHYDLTLTPVEDGLKHRPRANWTILSCEGSTNKLSVWVQQRVEATEQREASRLPSLVTNYLPALTDPVKDHGQEGA